MSKVSQILEVVRGSSIMGDGPQCDADKPQSPLAASNDAEVGHGVAELQQADWHIPGPCGPENWEQRAVRRVAEVKGDPPKPPLCWICGKPLPHDCVGDSGLPTNTKHGSVTVTANGLDIIIGSAHRSNGLLVERADVSDLLAAVAEAYGLKHSPAQSGQPTLTDLPKINLELPDGASREAKVRWSEWSADRKSLTVCVSVTHGPPQRFNGPTHSTVTAHAKALAKLHDGSEIANSFALTATPYRAHKWPIGTPAEPTVKDIPTWGNRLLAARSHRGLTLDALGARLTPPRTRKDISAMEHGRRGLSVELCAELAQALDCDRCWLAGWKEES